MTAVREQVNPFDVAFEAERRRLHHLVVIGTRYGETTRDCYCTATDGLSHHENQHPWYSAPGERSTV